MRNRCLWRLKRPVGEVIEAFRAGVGPCARPKDASMVSLPPPGVSDTTAVTCVPPVSLRNSRIRLFFSSRLSFSLFSIISLLIIIEN